MAIQISIVNQQLVTSVDQQMSLTHSFDTLNLLGTIGGNVENVPIAYTFKIPATHTLLQNHDLLYRPY